MVWWLAIIVLIKAIYVDQSLNFILNIIDLHVDRISLIY